MRFRVLGPLQVEADDGPLPVGGPKERLLLALLLARPNQVVSVQALIQGLWGDQPPATAAKTLQSHVKRLRRALEPGRASGAAGQVLITREPGYLLQVPPEALDAARFEELAAQARRALARGAAEDAAALLHEALGLWRGQAYQEFLDTDLAVAEADRLAELRLVAMEDRIEADLRLGRHRELVAELEGLVRDHPLRERLWSQLLLALYRSGRQADALLAYQRARSVLVEELGIDPGAELRRLHAAILAQDPGLDLQAPAEAGPTRELPEALEPIGPVFTGRADELAWLRAAWTRATHGRGGVTLVAGGQGIGKTRLAAEFAREVHDQGGRVLHGCCAPAASDPLQPFADALTSVGASLQDLPVPSPGRSPAALGQRLADLLAGRSDRAVLLVLDDLHLAQAPALEALAALVGAAVTRRLLVLGAYREEAVTPELAALVERLDPRRAARRWLGPFGQQEVAQVLSLYDSEPASQGAANAVLEATGGMPLLVHQAARDWAHTAVERQVAQMAGQTASSRSHLRLVQAKLADDVVDLRELGEHPEQVARLDASHGLPGGGEAEDRPAAVVCPYKGLARFEPDDAGFFFGRERLVAELVTHLVGAGLVGVVGPSGSGKSSLVRAGLLPALADGVLPGSDRWRQVLVRPGEHPVRELAEAADLPIAGQERVLLVVDQFEEAFTICRDEAERAAFLAALVEAAQADNSVTVVVAVRADYYGHCAADPRLASLLAANHVLVGPMDAGELRRAVELPARRAGLRLERGLADAMVAEVAEEPGGLPLLSCALLESWQHRRGRTLTLAAYQQAGGVHGAVARLAERAWLALDSQDQAVARRILLRLAGPGEGEAVVRRRVPLDEVAPTGDERGRAVLDTLTDQRLLTRGGDSVEVAHEALLREWPRLRAWLEEDVQGRTLHRHLIGAAGEWDQSGRDPGELYRGARLTAALDWAATHDADLNQLERAFLDASRAAAEREVADARRRADQEARTSRRLRGLVAGLAVVLVLALVAGGLALSLRGRAERVALVADSRRLGAQALLEDELDRSLLLARQGIALDDSVETRSDLLAALLRSPAAKAILRGDLDGIGAMGLSRDGRLLAVGDGGGRVEIYDTRTRKLLHKGFQGHHGMVGDLQFSPDGSLLAVPSKLEPSTTLPIWDVHDGKVRRQLSWADDRSVTGVKFSSDGRTLVALSEPNIGDPNQRAAFLTRWDVGSGRRLTGPVRISWHGGDWLLASPDGTRLVVVNSTETLVLAARSFGLLHRFPHKQAQGRYFTADLSPADGRTLALWPDGGSIEFLDLVSGRRRTGGRPEGGAWSIRFSPDGKILATGGDDTVKVWDVASGQLREAFQGHEARVAGLRFSVDGRTLYSSGSKSVIAWDLEGSSRLGRPYPIFTGAIPPSFFAVAGGPQSLAISADGALLAIPLPAALDKVAVLDLHAPRQARPPLAPGIGMIWALALSPDGTRLAVGSNDASVPVLIDVNSGRVQKMIGGGHRGGGVLSVSFAPDGKRLASGGDNDQQAIIWDTQTRRPIRRVQDPITNPEQPAGVTVGWSPDGSTLAMTGERGRILLWRAADGRRLAAWTADTRSVVCVAFSPDGSLLAAGGEGDRQVTLWDVASRKLVGRLPHPNFVYSVAFDPAGRTLATSTTDFKIRLWDLASLRQLGRPLPGDERGSGTNISAFDPSGKHLIAVYDSGAAFVWDMDPDRWKQQACAVVGRSLTRQEWTDLLPDRRYQPACR
jgi:WD40 repeat protein/DNA-binding SARP family transcriptional activator/type II secretory pathway predicted ATPase ExeA